MSRWILGVCAFLPVAIGPQIGPPARGTGSATESSPPEATVRFAEIYKFPLRATSRARGARGTGHLRLAQSPFGIPLTADGHVVYDLDVTVSGLRTRIPAGATYVAWITTPELDRIEKLGPVDPTATHTFHVATMNKFIFVVSLETSADVDKRSGPTMLRGVSPSGLMQNMESHELFSTMPHE